MGSFFLPVEISTESLTSNIEINSDADLPLKGQWQGEWSAAHIYAEADVVRKELELYESVADGNIGNDPETTTLIESPKWIALGKINRWRMFDEYVNSETIGNENGIVVTISNVSVNQIAIFGVVADSMQVEIIDEQGVAQWTYHEDLGVSRDIGTWYEFFFEPFPEVLSVDKIVCLPWMIRKSANEKVKISLTGVQTVCGHCSMGIERGLGETQWGPEVGRMFFGARERDAHGRITLGEGEVAKIINCDLRVKRGDEGYVDRRLSNLLKMRAVFDINNKEDTKYEPLIVYGFLGSYWEVFKAYNHTIVRMVIEGLI